MFNGPKIATFLDVKRYENNQNWTIRKRLRRNTDRALTYNACEELDSVRSEYGGYDSDEGGPAHQRQYYQNFNVSIPNEIF